MLFFSFRHRVTTDNCRSAATNQPYGHTSYVNTASTARIYRRLSVQKCVAHPLRLLDTDTELRMIIRASGIARTVDVYRPTSRRIGRKHSAPAILNLSVRCGCRGDRRPALRRQTYVWASSPVLCRDVARPTRSPLAVEPQ